MKIFDRKFGLEALAVVPDEPGVYRFLDAAGAVLYVGKAKRLRRRLGQYRCATQKRKHRRMRKIVRLAVCFVYEVTATHLDACLLEVRQIQELRPKLNVAATFSFMYPYVGLSRDGDVLRFTFTTRPELPQNFVMYGAFRSREVCADAFFSLMRLASFIGHKETLRKDQRPKRDARTYFYAFRRLPIAWYEAWREFFAGNSREALEDLCLELLEHPGARARTAEVQNDLRALQLFWENEASALQRAITATRYDGAYPIPQVERDPLFIRLREAAS